MLGQVLAGVVCVGGRGCVSGWEGQEVPPGVTGGLRGDRVRELAFPSLPERLGLEKPFRPKEEGEQERELSVFEDQKGREVSAGSLRAGRHGTSTLNVRLGEL